MAGKNKEINPTLKQRKIKYPAKANKQESKPKLKLRVQGTRLLLSPICDAVTSDPS